MSRKVINVVVGKSIPQQLDIEGDLKITETKNIYLFKLDISDAEKETIKNKIGQYSTDPFIFNVIIGDATETGAFSYQFCVTIAIGSEEKYTFSGYSIIDIEGTIVNIPSYGEIINNDIYITSIQV